MKYKFIGQENENDDHHINLQISNSEGSLEVIIDSETELQFPVFHKMLIDYNELDNMIHALTSIKDEIQKKTSLN